MGTPESLKVTKKRWMVWPWIWNMLLTQQPRVSAPKAMPEVERALDKSEQTIVLISKLLSSWPWIRTWSSGHWLLASSRFLYHLKPHPIATMKHQFETLRSLIHIICCHLLFKMNFLICFQYSKMLFFFTYSNFFLIKFCHFLQISTVYSPS